MSKSTDILDVDDALPLSTRESNDSEPQSETDQILETMQALLAEVPTASIRLKLYKLPKIGSGKTTFQWCEDFLPEEFATLDWEEIRMKWGPGTYQMRLIGPRGVAKSVTIEIANANPIAQSATQSKTELSQVLASLAENQARMLDALTTRPDPSAQMRDTLTLMATMREAFGIGPQPQSAPVDHMAMMREVFTMVREAKSAAKELADEAAPPSDDPMAMLPKMLDLVGAAMKQNNNQVPVMPMQIPQSFTQPQQNPIPQPQQNPIPQPQETDSTEDNETPEQTMILIHVNAIISMAKKNIPIETGAEYIVANLPEDLMKYLDDPNMFENVKRYFPGVAAHEKWILAAVDRAKTILKEETDEEPDAI